MFEVTTYADNQINLNANKILIQDFLSLFGAFGPPEGAPIIRRTAGGTLKGKFFHYCHSRSRRQVGNISLKLTKIVLSAKHYN